MEMQEIQIIRRALDTEVEHKEYVKNVTKAKIILNKYEALQTSQDQNIFLLSNIRNSILANLEKMVSKYLKTQKNAIDNFDYNVNYGKVEVLREAIDVVKKYCL